MALPNISTSPHDYVVLDVETNGLKSKEDDLLSISLFKPDDCSEYDRFLPLDLNPDVFTTEINGIRKRDLKNKQHLTQEEVDKLVGEFELDQRIILHYGSLDFRFIRDYFDRHNLKGFECLRFFNFKQLICSPGFSDGSLSKDNLCIFFGIDGISDIHSGIRDCKLEWKLFKKIDGRYLLARIVPNGQYSGMWRLAVLNPGYILPISYLTTYKNLSRIIERPYIRCDAEEVFRLKISGEHILRFPTNFSGMTIEHLIDVALDANEADNREFLTANSSKNEFIGYIPSYTSYTPMSFNDDGTVTAARVEDEGCEKEINSTIEQMREQLTPLIEFINSEIFHCASITSQELVVDNELGILSLCDLSTEDAVLEIKTSQCNPEKYAEQLHYEAKGRPAYLLGMEWGFDGKVPSAVLTIKKVNTYPGDRPNKRRDKAMESLTAILSSENIEVVSYVKSTSPVGIRCKTCGHEWEETYPRIRAGKCVCAICHPERHTERRTRCSEDAQKLRREVLTSEQALERRAQRYAEKVSLRSGGTIEVDISGYTGGRNVVHAQCRNCGHSWALRADHLLSRPYCPKCRNGN